jgi:hypothetical protein
MALSASEVRFAPESGHQAVVLGCPLYRSAESQPRNPTIGIAGCCARGERPPGRRGTQTTDKFPSPHARYAADCLKQLTSVRGALSRHGPIAVGIVIYPCRHEDAARQRPRLCNSVLVLRGAGLGRVVRTGGVVRGGASLNSWALPNGTIDAGRSCPSMPSEPMTPAQPQPAEPSEPPVTDPQPYTDPVQSPPGDPNEDRPMRDPVTPGKDRPRS